MTTITTSSSTDLDGLLAAVLDTPPWIDEPTVERLVKVLLLDPHAARPFDLVEDANRSGWDDLRTMAAKVVDGGCHAAVRRRADEVSFHVRRIAALLGRCVDLPADTGNEIRNLLRNSLLGSATREALVRVLLAAGASIEQAPAIATSVEPADDGQAEAAVERADATTRRPASKERQRALADLQAFLQKEHTAKILNALAEPRQDLKAVAKAADVTEQIVKNYSAEMHRHKLWKQDEDGCWILARRGIEQLAKTGLEVNPTRGQIQDRKKQLRESPR